MSKIHVEKVGSNYEVYNYSKKFTGPEVLAHLDKMKFELAVMTWFQDNLPQPARIIEYLEVFQGLTSVQGCLEKKARLQQRIDEIEALMP